MSREVLANDTYVQATATESTDPSASEREGSEFDDGSLGSSLRWIVSFGYSSRHAPWGHGPRNVSIGSGASGIRTPLTGYNGYESR